MITEFTNTAEVLAIGLAVVVSKQRILPFALMIACFFILAMYSHHQVKIDMMDQEENINWFIYNLTLSRYYLTESVVIFFIAIALCFIEGGLAKIASFVLFINSSFCALCGMAINSNLLIASHYYVQYLFVIIIVLIAWICAIVSRTDSK